MSDPDEITIIVHSAKGLKGKKPGRHKFSVIFGLGAVKFRTAIVKDASGNPDWNEETVAHVSNILDQVFFIVTEKDDILGQISVPVTSIRATKGLGKRQPLQPHKRCPNPEGDLVYQCYVSRYRAPGDHVPIIKDMSSMPQDVRPQSAFQRLRKRMASPVMQRRSKYEPKKEKDHKSGSLSSFNKKLSRSIQDLFSFGKLSAGDTINVDEEEVNHVNKNSKNKRKFSLNFLSVSNNLDQAGEDPVITQVSPNSGPIDQPTQICIEGRNLGMGKSDIMSLTIAGCDCTDTIEYESSTKIYCTTHFWKVTKGAVVIDTISGGIGTLVGGFTFYEELDANDNNSISTNKNPFDTADDEGDKIEDTTFEFSIGGREIKSGFNTIPRTRTSWYSESTKSPPSPVVDTPSGRYRKKHTRNASESAVMGSTPKTPVERVSKEELQEKIIQLEVENAALKKDNVGMKSYIDKIVSKCMLHCPEALAQDDDEKSKLYVL